MSLVNNFDSLAMGSVVSDWAFFCQQVGSTDTFSESEYTSSEVADRFSAKCLFPVMNGVLQKSNQLESVTDSFVQQQIDYFAQLSVPHIWWLTNEEQHNSIGPLLESNGYTFAGDYLAFAANTTSINESSLPKMPLDSQIEVAEVSTPEEYDIFAELLSNIFGFDSLSLERCKNTMKNYGPSKPYRHFYATIDHKVVGVISALFRNGWCSVWNGGVLPVARGLGVGRALCLKLLALREEEHVGGYTGLLMADAQAKGLAKKFGAHQVGNLFPYFFGVTSEEFEPK